MSSSTATGRQQNSRTSSRTGSRVFSNSSSVTSEQARDLQRAADEGILMSGFETRQRSVTVSATNNNTRSLPGVYNDQDSRGSLRSSTASVDDASIDYHHRIKSKNYIM